jgi:hypothetical protein
VSETQSLTKIPSGELAAPASEPVNMLDVIRRAASDPACDVGKMEKLLEMAERMDAKRAEQEFNRAFAMLQSEMPVIVAKTEIKNRGKYEKFEDIMEVVGPLLKRNGFAISFDQAGDDKRITVTCTLRHIGGHSHKNPFSVRIGVAADSNTQADCKVSTTARRNALLQALNIVVRQDCMTREEDDATLEGDPSVTVTPAQADELEHRVAMANRDKVRFLKTAGAATFRTIPASKYNELDAMLRRVEGGGK